MDRRVLAFAASLALVAGTGVGTVRAADRDVAIAGFAFSPRTVTVNVGDAITWTNRDGQTHTATSGVPGTPATSMTVSRDPSRSAAPARTTTSARSTRK